MTLDTRRLECRRGAIARYTVGEGHAVSFPITRDVIAGAPIDARGRFTLARVDRRGVTVSLWPSARGVLRRGERRVDLAALARRQESLTLAAGESCTLRLGDVTFRLEPARRVALPRARWRPEAASWLSGLATLLLLVAATRAGPARSTATLDEDAGRLRIVQLEASMMTSTRPLGDHARAPSHPALRERTAPARATAPPRPITAPRVAPPVATNKALSVETSTKQRDARGETRERRPRARERSSRRAAPRPPLTTSTGLHAVELERAIPQLRRGATPPPARDTIAELLASGPSVEALARASRPPEDAARWREVQDAAPPAPVEHGALMATIRGGQRDVVGVDPHWRRSAPLPDFDDPALHRALGRARARGVRSVMSKGVIQVDGSRSAKTVAKVARHFIPSLRRCYEAALTRRARVRGELVIAFTIRGDGTIAEAAPRASTLGAPEVGECVARIISKWRFASGGGQATVVLPIRYSPR